MKRKLHDFYLKLIRKEKNGLPYDLLRGLLWGISCFFSLAVKTRLFLYRKKILKSVRPEAYTISVGNLVAGGTGKTPFTIFLASELLKNRDIAILLRGYKGKKGFVGSVKGPQGLLSAVEVGDEARLIQEKVPNAQVIVGKKRVDSCKLAKDAKVLLLDDGMQHLQLQRDLEIVLIDATNPFGYGALLPRGLLREPLSSLKRAGLVVLTRVDEGNNIELLEDEIRKWTLAPIVHTQMEFDGIFDHAGNRITLEKGTPVGVFCAIGNPQSFLNLVQKQKLQITTSVTFPDHERISLQEMKAFTEQARRAQARALLCTEKDVVKAEGFSSVQLPLFHLRISLQVVKGEEHLVDCFQKVPAK